MNILVVLRNLYNNPDPFDEESLLCDSDINVLTEACDIRDSRGGGCTVTALLISESTSDFESVLKKAASYGADTVVHAACDDFEFSDANSFGRLIAKIVEGIALDKASGGSFDTPTASNDETSQTFDMVMFGRLAYDGDSVNIATQTAENLNWHRAIYSQEILEVTKEFTGSGMASGESGALNKIQSRSLIYKKALDDGGTATTEIKLPAVVHTIRRGGLRRQAKVADIMRAYGETEIISLPGHIIESAKKKAAAGPFLPTPVQEIPPYADKTDMVVLNGVSDVDTAANIIETLKSLGFEPKA